MFRRACDINAVSILSRWSGERRVSHLHFLLLAYVDYAERDPTGPRPKLDGLLSTKLAGADDMILANVWGFVSRRSPLRA